MDSVRSFGTNLNPFKSTTPTSSYSDFSMNNIVIIVTFGIMVYVLVQMLIVLNRPEFLYYTLSPIPTDLENETFGKVNYSEKLPLAKLNEFTYSFWVYLREVKNVSGADDNPKPQLLFMRNNKDDFENANPVVYIENNTNTMKIALRTSESSETGLDDIHENSSDAYEHFTIKYIPVKRWVNVMINVDNKRVTIFLDGEIVSTKILDNSVSETNSDVYVGKSDEAGNRITIPNALISKIQFFNYSIRTPNDIRKIYDDGPIKKQTVMRMLGLPNIGVRSPIYNLEKSCDN
jgi:hypothetical protein